MNKTYRNVWNAATNTWTAAAETAKGRTKGSARAARSVLVALALGGAGMSGAFAAEACTTADGKNGTLDTAGVCQITSGTTVGSIGTMGTIGTSAIGVTAIDGTTIGQYFNGNGGGTYAAPTVGVVGDMAIGLAANANSASVVGDHAALAIGFNAKAVGGRNAAIGMNANASANDAVAMGYNANAQFNNAIAIGSGSKASSQSSVAMGFGAQTGAWSSPATPTGAVAIGNGAYADAGTASGASNASSVAMGGNAKAYSGGSVAIGSGAQAAVSPTTGAGGPDAAFGVAIGTNSQSANGASAIGYLANASGNGSTAMGIRSTVDANATNGVAMGNSASVKGNSTTYTANNSVAIGNGASVAASSTAAADSSVALGNAASVTASNAVALGAGSVANTANTVSVGNATTQRKIVNMAAGTAPTDAVNVSQLAPVVTALGGGATINADGSVTGPSYTLANGTGTPATSIGDAFSQLDGALTTTNGRVGDLEGKLGSGTIGLVQQAGAGQKLTVGKDTDGTQVDFTNSASASRTLTGVAAGAVAAGSTEAINGSQLFATANSVANAIGATSTVNPDGTISLPSFTVGDGKGGTTTVHNVGDVVTNLDGRTTTNETSITTINNQLKDLSSGTIGLVQQTSAGADLTVGAATNGAAVNFAGTAGARKLTGVADGDLSATSTEAVNGAQLNATNTAVTNLDNRVTGIDGRVTTAETNITNLQTAVGSGAIGLVQQATPTGDITVASGSGGSVVNFAGSGNVARTLSGVAPGSAGTDAVNIAQLTSMLGVKDLAPLMAVRYDDTTMQSATLGGDPAFGTYLNNVAPGLIASGSMQAVNGGQLFDMQAKYDGLIGALDGRVGAIESGGGTGGPGSGTPGGSVPSPGTGSGSVAVGAGSDASGSNSSAIGNGAVASGENSTALGQGAQASNNNSVAIGAGSKTDRDNEVSFGSAGNERILSNVADGQRDTDAVNVRQLNNAVGGLNNKIDSNHRDAMGGVAAAMAVAGLPQSSLPGKTFMSIAGSTYGGEQGTAIGASYMSTNGKWVVKGAMNTSTRGEVGAVVGGGFYW